MSDFATGVEVPPLPKTEIRTEVDGQPAVVDTTPAPEQPRLIEVTTEELLVSLADAQLDVEACEEGVKDAKATLKEAVEGRDRFVAELVKRGELIARPRVVADPLPGFEPDRVGNVPSTKDDE